MSYICTLLLLLRSSGISVGGLAECLRHMHCIKLPVVMEVCICHIIPPPSQMTSSLSVTAKNYAGTLNAQIIKNTPDYC